MDTAPTLTDLARARGGEVPWPEPPAGWSPDDAAESLGEAVAVVAGDLAAAERVLFGLLQSPITPIPDVAGHLVFAGGKRLRPLVTLLAAKACGFEGEARLTVAAVGELLHSATLLHDDVVDDAGLRRGRPAARIPWGNGMAVLTGDYCLARSLQAIAATGSLRAIGSMADTVTAMAEGEVAQLWAAGDAVLDRDRYDDIIRRKTATLLAWCASVGGLVDEPALGALERFGLALGRAFQLADDVLDYTGDAVRAGKPRWTDLREGKLTLPLILACEADPEIWALVRDRFAPGLALTEPEVAELAHAVLGSGAIARATAAAIASAEQAVAELDPVPDGPARRALERLARKVANRRR